MCISDPTPETTRSIVLLRLSNTKPNGTLKTPPKSIQVNSRAEIPDCVKITQLQMKLVSTAAMEIKLLSALHRSVNSVITTALASGARRTSHGRRLIRIIRQIRQMTPKVQNQIGDRKSV